MIGYIEKAQSYFQDNRPKKAQSVPASLFWREEGLGIFREPWNGKEMAGASSNYGGLHYMPFDLFISERHEMRFRVSDHPLQDGAVISDHIHKELQTVTIEGMFTNHPMRKLEETNQVKFKDEYATSEVKNTLPNRALQKFEELKLLAQYKTPVRLVCSLQKYPKMVITSLKYERDSKSGSSIRFTMELREIKIVNFSATTNTNSPYDFVKSYYGQVELNKKLSKQEKARRKKEARTTAPKRNLGNKTLSELKPEDWAQLAEIGSI